MAKVQIPHQDRLKQLLTYEPETGMLYWKERPQSAFANNSTRAWKSWNAVNAGKPALSRVNHNGYLCGTIEGVSVLAHRVIWKLVHGYEPDQVDHQDGVRANNRLENLRCVTSAGNRQNVAKSVRNRSGAVGVCWVQRWPQYPGRWVATIGNKVIGRFESFDDAFAARKAAEIQNGYHENHGRPKAAHSSIAI